jgi:hypothetical protein
MSVIPTAEQQLPTSKTIIESPWIEKLVIAPKYNVSVYDYGGEMQYRFYLKPITTNRKKNNSSKTDKEFLDSIIESESGTIEHFENILKSMDDKQQRSALSSANRAKNKTYEYARANTWDYFTTMTFDKTKVDRYCYDSVSKKMSQWLKDARKRKAPNLKYIMVPEMHDSEKSEVKCGDCGELFKNSRKTCPQCKGKNKVYAWHFHGLWANTGELKFSDSEKKDSFKRVIYNIDNFKIGLTTATEISDSKKASNYISKYITKTLCNQIKGKRAYWPSRNLEKPHITRLDLSPDEKKVLLLSIARHITHSSSVKVNLDGYKQQINYYETIISQEIE